MTPAGPKKKQPGGCEMWYSAKPGDRKCMFYQSPHVCKIYATGQPKSIVHEANGSVHPSTACMCIYLSISLLFSNTLSSHTSRVTMSRCPLIFQLHTLLLPTPLPPFLYLTHPSPPRTSGRHATCPLIPAGSNMEHDLTHISGGARRWRLWCFVFNSF